jgi:hypothetical protein
MKRIIALAVAPLLLIGGAYAAPNNPHGEDSKGLWQINSKAKKNGTPNVKANDKAKNTKGRYLRRKDP